MTSDSHRAHSSVARHSWLKMAAGMAAIFRGIPYGAPTSGARRFMAPTTPAPWTGVRSALALGFASPQIPPEHWDKDEVALMAAVKRMSVSKAHDLPPFLVHGNVADVWWRRLTRRGIPRPSGSGA